MQLQPHTRQADPELWRALHEQRFLAPQRGEDVLDARSDTLHGMPADRLAMAASRWSLDGRTREH